MNLKTPPTFRALPLVVLVFSVLSATPGNEADDVIYAIGVEIAIAQIIFLRGGTQMIPDYDDEPAYGFGFGAPIKSFRLRFDYGVSDSFFFEDEMSLLAAWEF